METRFPNMVIWLWLGICASCALAAGDAETVYRKTQHAVAFIHTGDGFGSGVVVNAKGLVLTNLHVVGGNETVNVTLSVMQNRRVAEKTLRGRVVAGHPKYDLATVQVSLPPGASVHWLRFERRPVPTGATCYAIGNPGAGGGALRNAISQGLVSSASQIVNGQAFIQTTAQINPGNSGGALVNSAGRLIGIVTFKISNREGLGFAIPVRKLSHSDFHKRHLDRRVGYGVEQVIGGWFDSANKNGIIMVLAGLAFLAISSLWILIAAFRVSLGWGLTLLIVGSFFPVVYIVFVFLNWQDAKRPVVTMILGAALIISGVIFGSP